MNVRQRGHWWTGEESPGPAEWETQVGDQLHTWPRARRRDVARAFEEAAGEGSSQWRATAPRARARRLAEVVEVLANDREWIEGAAARFGLEPAEVGIQAAGLAGWRPRAAATTREVGPALHLGHWSEGLALSAARCLARLAAGQPLIHLGDPEMPWTGAALARACSLAELPDGVFQCLHGATPELASAWAEAPEGGVRPSRIQGRVDSQASGWARRPEVEEAGLERWERSWVGVAGSGSQERAALRVVRAAFGRSEALGGQAHGRVGVVCVEEGCLSSFTEALLAALEACDGFQRPLAPVARVVERAHQDVVRRALQAGECLIEGADTPGAARAAFRPTVFTNAEVGQDAVRDRRPVPLLHLLRLPRGTRLEDPRSGDSKSLELSLGSRWHPTLG